MSEAQRNFTNYTIPRVKKTPKGSAKNGECKFDGTDYPEWLGFDPKPPGGTFTNPFPTIDGDPWEKTMHMHDDEMCDMWDGEIQNLLVFSGLFSAVVTAFAIETQKLLEADPDKAAVLLLAQLAGQLAANATVTESISGPFQNPNSPSQTFRVNVLMFSSLVISLGTALVGIVALQWIRSYRSSESQSDRERLILRQIRYAALVKWKVPTIISYLPPLLGTALLIFFVGLVDFLDTMNSNVAIIIGILVGLISLFILITTILPPIHIFWHDNPMPPCAYQSPQSWIWYRILNAIFVRDNKRTSYCKNWSELILDLHKKSISLDPRNGDTWLKNTLVWLFTKFNSPHSFRFTYHCLQSIRDINVRWDIVSEVIGDLKDTGEDIWKDIQSTLPPVARAEFIPTLLLLSNCPRGPEYGSHASELFYRCVHNFRELKTDRETWPEYENLIQLWLGKMGSVIPNGATLSPEERTAYLATFLLALESNLVTFHQVKLTFNLFWKFLALRVQDEDSVPTVLDCLRILTHWFLRVEQLPPDVYRSWDDNFVLRYSLRGIFDYNVFNLAFVTPELYNHPTFTAFLDIFIDPKNKCLKEGWRDAVQASWSDKWDDFLLETGINHKYWELSDNKKRLEQRYSGTIRRWVPGCGGAGEVTIRGPASNSQLDLRTLHPDQAWQNDNSNITSIPERNSGSSFSALSNIDVIDPSAIPLTDVLTHAPANVPPSRPPIPRMPLSNTSTLYPPGQTPPLMLDLDDQKPLLTSSPRSSLDTRGEGGTSTPP